MVIDKTTGKGCAWSIVSRTIAQRLIDDGIVGQAIARRPYHKSYALLRVAGHGKDAYIEVKKDNSTQEEPLWVPSFIDAGRWKKAAQKFRTQGRLDENIMEHLLPELVDCLQRIPEEALVSLTREFLIKYGILDKPIRQSKGTTYYFNQEEIYSLDKGLLFPIWGRMKLQIFGVTGAEGAFFSNSVWRKAATQFKAGMTLNECVGIFLKTELIHHVPPEQTPVDRLVQYITPPVYERVPGNTDETTFDRIRISVNLPRYQFDSWEALRDEVKKYQSEIVQRVVQTLEKNRQFKKYGVPLSFLRLSNLTLLRDFSLEFIFELKEQKLDDTERVCTSKNH